MKSTLFQYNNSRRGGLSLFLLCLILLASLQFYGCSEKPDYQRLTSEEVEILFRNGHPELLSLVCRKYHDEFILTPQEEWLVLGEKYRTKVKDRFLIYCQQNLEAGNRQAACMLKDYYAIKLDTDTPDVPRFLLYARKCQGDNILKNFIQNDSVFAAIVQVTQDMAATLTRRSDDITERAGTFEKMLRVIDDAMTDLRHVRDGLILYGNQEKSLRKTLRSIKRKLSKRLDTLKLVISGYTVPNFSLDAPDLLDTRLKTNISELYFLTTEIEQQLDNCDRQTLIYIRDIKESFEARKESFLKKYRQELM